MAAENVIFESESVPEGDARASVLGILAENKPYLFITVPEVNLETHQISLTLDHNAGPGNYTELRFILEQVIESLPKAE